MLMKILVININTSVTITDKIRSVLNRIKRPDTHVDVVCPEHGPITIDSSFDEAFAVPPTLELVGS